MGGLGYGTREPLVSKLKQLVDDIQTVYEEFLDAETLYQEDKISDKEFFKKMGVFVKVFSSLGFLSVKVIIEIIMGGCIINHTSTLRLKWDSIDNIFIFHIMFTCDIWNFWYY